MSSLILFHSLCMFVIWLLLLIHLFFSSTVFHLQFLVIISFVELFFVSERARTVIKPKTNASSTQNDINGYTNNIRNYKTANRNEAEEEEEGKHSAQYIVQRTSSKRFFNVYRAWKSIANIWTCKSTACCLTVVMLFCLAHR